MGWMTPLLVAMAGLFAFANYSTVMASRRAAGQDAPDRAGDARALAWRAAANGARRWAYAVIFGSVAWGLLKAPATSGRDMGVGVLALCAAGFLLSGATRLATAAGLLRDARLIESETRP